MLSPAETDAAGPPLLPPGTLSKFQGSRVGEKAEFSVDFFENRIHCSQYGALDLFRKPPLD